MDEKGKRVSRNRLFYTIDDDSHRNNADLTCEKNQQLVQYISDSVIGKDKCFTGPFGPRKALYLDYTASGRSLSFIEDYIRENVLPEYGNTHTTTTVTSLQTTLYRHEARDIIRNAVNASEHDAVIFCGSGTTAAVQKLIHGLDLGTAPIVLVGPYEHHSNLLPWRNIAHQVITIQETGEGVVDLMHLESVLKRVSNSQREIIGCFSAASNITGILTDTDRVTSLLHRYGGKAFWDYATAAPYVKVDMNPVVIGPDQPYVYKDAIYFSMHKFVGGVSTPGVLVAKKSLFQSRTPQVCGGGTVFFVRGEGERYLKEPELREEGGTPDIVGSVRAGLVIQLKGEVGSTWIMEHDSQLVKQALTTLQTTPNLHILGSTTSPRLPVISFIIHHPTTNYFLHHNYVTALLNDLFGIQARGGCACAGPYAQRLLGIDEELAAVYEDILAEDDRLDRVHLRRQGEYSDREILSYQGNKISSCYSHSIAYWQSLLDLDPPKRPGFTRICLPYFLTDDEVTFTLEALTLVATDGWKLLPKYMFNPQTGEWRARHHQVFKERKWLGHISYRSGVMEYKQMPPIQNAPTDLQDVLRKAREEFSKAQITSTDTADQSLLFDEELQTLRWFLLPSEAQTCLRQENMTGTNKNCLPFCPEKLQRRLIEENGGKSILSEDYKRYFLPSSGAVNIVRDLKNLPAKCIGMQSAENAMSDRHSMDKTTSVENISNQIELLMSEVDEKCDGKKSEFQVRGNRPNKLTGKNYLSQCEISNLEKESSLNTDLDNREIFCPRIETDSSSTSVNLNVCLNNDCEIDPILHTNTVELHDENTTTQNTGDCPKNSNRNCESENSIHESNQLDTQKFDVTTTESANILTSSTSATKICNTEEISAEYSTTSTSVCEMTVCKVKHEKNVKIDAEIDGRNSLWFCPGKNIFKPFLEAMGQYEMVKSGDKVLICLSGGKDSLSLLHSVHQYQFYAKAKGIKFEMGAVTVDPGTPSYDPTPLIPYLASLGVPYFYEKQDIMDTANNRLHECASICSFCSRMKRGCIYFDSPVLYIMDTANNLPYECASICSFCSRMKRGRIYAAARREGYNVIALGQHLDDLAESFLMSVFHNGVLRTMKACYTVGEGDLRVIRPFVHVREKDLRKFAEKSKLPVIPENCPACFEAPKERQRIKQLLASQEILHPRVYSSLRSAMVPLVGLGRNGTLGRLGDGGDDEYDL